MPFIVWDEPYALALVKNTLEIRVLSASDSTKDTFIQTIPDLQNARLLVCGKPGLVFAASVSKLWCIEMVEIPKQLQNLLQQKKFHLALQLTVTTLCILITLLNIHSKLFCRIFLMKVKKKSKKRRNIFKQSMHMICL